MLADRNEENADCFFLFVLLFLFFFLQFELCHIHHTDPSRKGGAFADLCSKGLAAMKKEEENNTDKDGTIHLTALCADHHAEEHHADTKYKGKVKDALDAVNAFKRSRSKCSHKNCKKKDLLCVEGNEFMFDLDHIFDKKSDTEGRSLRHRKLANVSSWAHYGKKEEALEEAQKCRLIHRSCHVEHSRDQVKDKNAWINQPGVREDLVKVYPHLAYLFAEEEEEEEEEEEKDDEEEEDDVEEEPPKRARKASSAAAASHTSAAAAAAAPKYPTSWQCKRDPRVAAAAGDQCNAVHMWLMLKCDKCGQKRPTL